VTAPHDQQIIDRLIEPRSKRPAHIRPGESVALRLLVFVTAPIWVSAIGVAILARLGRGRRPLFVAHERVGHRREVLWVPKIATAAVAGNQRKWLGLVELAAGPPADLNIDGGIEHWLRRTGIDELPQLGLVLGGTMRLVGPRPVTPTELAEMTEDDPEAGIDFLQPGLVGLWQVLDRHAYLLPERRAFDMMMVDNWSPRLRRRILALSLRQAIGRASAT